MSAAGISEHSHRLRAERAIPRKMGENEMGLILVIEDDAQIVKALTRLFTMEGYRVKHSGNGKDGLQLFFKSEPDAVVLDLMLPGMSGRDVCRSIRQEGSDIPIVILSAIAEVTDKVLLLELGADDYVTKPFSPRELLARVEAAIRRSQKSRSKPHQVGFGNVQVNFSKMQVQKEGRPVELTALEFKLLRFFFDNADRVVSREELLSDVWKYNDTSVSATTRTVDNQILKLRQKLEDDPGEPVHFCTMHGVGYKFVQIPS
jgi:DNA-binding response OmpR family regulator